jgi:hypothetical protein
MQEIQYVFAWNWPGCQAAINALFGAANRDLRPVVTAYIRSVSQPLFDRQLALGPVSPVLR